VSGSAVANDRFIVANGLRIHYLDWGSPGKQPLILLHGIARGAHNFDHLAPRFVGDYHVIAVDMRGHGDSEWHPAGEYLVEDYTSDVVALIEQLALRNVVLWGNSTGGRVAQMIAGLHTSRVSAVIVEDVGPERPAAISNRRAGRMAEEENGWASTDELFTKTKAGNSLTSDAILRSFVEHGSKKRADGRLVWKRDPAILKGFVPTELWDSVRRIEAPIIYILGGASTIVPPETQAQLKAALPQAQIVTMPELGHYPSDEQPEAFVAIVEDFLSGSGRRRGR
jgi:pimeloyl-ACP methyl ester carboxylesterase